MKTPLITTTILILLTGVTFAQNQVQYTYDDAGNRIKRESSTTQYVKTQDLASQDSENKMISGVDLQAHPNPTEQNTEITIIIDPETIAEADQIALASGVTIQLADVSGKILKTQNIGAYDHTPIPVDLQDLSQGIYFVKVFTTDGKLIGERKIIRR